MSNRVILATEGDTLDLIVFNACGSTTGGILEQAFELNPHLCDTPYTVLAAGTPVILPPLTKTSGQKIRKTIQLWD